MGTLQSSHWSSLASRSESHRCTSMEVLDGDDPALHVRKREYSHYGSFCSARLPNADGGMSKNAFSHMYVESRLCSRSGTALSLRDWMTRSRSAQDTHISCLNREYSILLYIDEEHMHCDSD